MHPSSCLVKPLHASDVDLQIIFRSVCREDTSLNIENSEKFSYSALGMVQRYKERQTRWSHYEKVPLQGTVLNIFLKYVKINLRHIYGIII